MKVIAKILILAFLISCTNVNNDKYYNLACKAEKNGDYKLAIEYLDKALKIKPNDLFALNNRGWDKYDSGDTLGVLNDFNLMIYIDSVCDRGYYNRGDLLIHQQKYIEALSDFNKVVQLKGGGPLFFERTKNDFVGQPEKPETSLDDLFYWKGVANYYTRDYKTAFNDFSYCIKGTKYIGDSYYMRAFIYFNTGHKDLGCKDLENAALNGYKILDDEYKKYCK